MIVNNISSSGSKNNLLFKSTRILKNTVSQLSKSNKYSLTEPNQRYIAKSIEELGKNSGESILRFLLKTASKLQYSTNIKLEDTPLNDWRSMLLTAAANVLENTPILNKTEFTAKIKKLSVNSNLKKIEKDILKLRDKLLKAVDIKQIETETYGGIKDFKHNLDYLIVSSETTLEHKKYILERLNYLMSDDYHIDPQIANKKSIVAAELVNDMAIFTPGHEVPNIKAVNQKQHGVCAAISIVRKKIAYEDKPNYIDTILSELDDSYSVSVFNRSKLGTGEKSFLTKVPVDYIAALEKGYRIIDASSMQWMQFANTSGYSGKTLNLYTPFDKDNFDINEDTFFNINFEDSELQSLHMYYQALLKAEDEISDYKASKLKAKTINSEKDSEFRKNIKAVNDVVVSITHIISSLFPLYNKRSIVSIVNKLFALEKQYSYDIENDDKYSYISNEELSVKKQKVLNFLNEELLKSNGKAIKNVDTPELSRIFDLIESYHYFNYSAQSAKPSKYNLGRARALYRVAAGNRYQFKKGLENETTLNYMMKKERIPSRELCISDVSNILINKLKENSDDSKYIIKSLSYNVGVEIDDESEAIGIIEHLRNEAENIIDCKINEIYNSLGLENRIEGLIEYIESLQIAIANDGDEYLMKYVSDNLGIKNSQDNIIAALEEIKNELILNGEKSYDDVFNKLGSSSQFIFLQGIFNKLMDDIEAGDQELLEKFIEINNLDISNPEEAVNSEISKIQEQINIYDANIEMLSRLLIIRDDAGDVLYSPIPADLIIKKLENNNSITNASSLRELQVHLDKIQKERSVDEFNARQGKLKDKSLYKFSKTEQITLDKIEKNLNPLLRYIKKQLTSIRNYIKIPLEELKRSIGVDMGHWWVPKEGTSGLFDGQDVRILEYITGRPHYTSKNILKAIEKIKTSPYSGNTSSSVSHRKPGMHVQYIADVEPVEIKVKENGQTKSKTVDILFQDNTWGASEHENIWTDSTGLQRTDYSADRGGTLGYVTNAKFRNGNIVSRIVEDMVLEEELEPVNNKIYKRIKKTDDYAFNSPQYSSIIIDGRSPAAKDIARSIYDAIFTPTVNLVSSIKKLSKDLNYSEINTKLSSIKSFKNNWESVSDDLIKRILDKDNNPIQTEADYEKLANDDYLKITLEKAALMMNYSMVDVLLDMPRINDISELNKYRNMQKQRAIKDFEYAFGKRIDIIDYLADNILTDDIEKIDEFLKKYNITLTDREYDEIFKTFGLEYSEFNGSMRHTINVLVKNVINKLGDKVSDDAKKKELSDLLKQILNDKVYFKASDINKSTIKNVIDFIDRVYNPSDNDELVKIYRKLQNMTGKEFKALVEKNLTNQDLGIKDNTGYQLLKKIQRYETGAENSLKNSVYYDLMQKETERPKYKLSYTYSKLHRTPKATAKYNFESAYNEMKYDLYLLNLAKSFDKYKGANIDKYGAYPAYPQVNYITDSVYKIIMDNFIKPIKTNMEKVKAIHELETYYELSDELKNFVKDMQNGSVIEESRRNEFIEVFTKLADIAEGDDGQELVYSTAKSAINELENGQYGRLKSSVKKINKFIDDYKKVASVEHLEKELADTKKLVSLQTDMLVQTYIRTRYQNKFMEILNDFKKSFSKNIKDEDGNSLSVVYEEELKDALKAYLVLEEPEEVLDRYVKSLASDSPLNKYSASIESMLRRALNFSKLCEIQSLVMKATSKGIETDVRSSFDNIYVQLKDGTSVPMSSDSVIYQIVNALVCDDQEETALLFLDKLGLNETYVSYVADAFDYDGIKEMIDNAIDRNSKYREYTKLFNQCYQTAYDELRENKNPSRVLNKMKTEIMKAAKTYGLEKAHSKIFPAAIDVCKLSFNLNPNVEPSEVFYSIMFDAGKKFENEVASYFELTNNFLDSEQALFHFINNVMLNSDSEAAKLRDEVNNKFMELVQYNNECLHNLHGE